MEGTSKQGDQIVRIIIYWAIVNFGIIFELLK
jgi:hypothetical protein